MRAIIHEAYGDPRRVLRIGDVEKPGVGDSGVLVRVRAASVNAGDWRRVRANPAFVRAVEGLRRPRVQLLGGDVAGIAEEVGNEVDDVRPGDEVYGIRTGAFAEYVSGKNIVRKPSNLSLEEAAAVPIAGVTALQAVREHGRTQAGDRVLVNGAGGGVGTFAVQIASADGAEVTAVTAPKSVDTLRSLGAHRVVDYTREDFTRSSERYDVIVDIGGNRSVRRLRRVLAPGGRLVLVGAGHGPGGALGRFVGGTVRKRVLRQPIAMFIAAVRREELIVLRELIEAGRVRPVIDRSYPLDQVPDALVYLESGHPTGKIVITI